MKNKKWYRERIKELSQYVNMSKLVDDLGINHGMYFLFMRGKEPSDDGKVGYDKLEKIVKALEQRPIGNGIVNPDKE